MEVLNIGVNHKEKCAELYIKEFEDSQEFEDSFKLGISGEYTLGAFDGGELVGTVIAFDYKNAMQSNEIEFNSIFGIKQYIIPYEQEIHRPICNLKKPIVIYIQAVIVEEWHRNKGIATQMIKCLADKVGSNASIVCTVAGHENLSMWVQNGFYTLEIDDDYYLCIRE